MDQSRRDALKKLSIATGVGAAATTEWAKPVVNGIIVPAHAQTTSGSSGGSLSASDISITGFGGITGITITSTTDYSGQAWSIVVAGTTYSGTLSLFDGSTTLGSINPGANLTSGTAYSVTVAGQTLSVTA
jgi:uncharacterized membrane protein